MRGSGEKGAYADETAVCAFEGEARRASRGFPAAAKPRRGQPSLRDGSGFARSTRSPFQKFAPKRLQKISDSATIFYV